MRLTEKQRRRIAKREGIALDRVSEDGGIILYRDGDPITCPGCGRERVLKPGDSHPGNPPCDFCEARREENRRAAKNELNGSETILDGVFAFGNGPRRGIRPGCTVNEALEAALSARRSSGKLSIRVLVRRANSLCAWYSAVVDGRTARWSLSG
jgi:hypothetical protein